MITIIYDAYNLSLLFPVASALLKYEAEDNCLILPMETKNLGDRDSFLGIKKFIKRNGDFDDDYEDKDEFLDDIIYSQGKIGEDKFILLGIYPANEEETTTIVEFFDSNQDKIILWVDSHKWPSGLLKYLKGENKNIFISDEFSVLELMIEQDFVSESRWLRAEKAIQNTNLHNRLAARYIKAMVVSRTEGWNFNRAEDYGYYLFINIVNELINDEKNNIVSKLASSFKDMVLKTSLIKKQISDSHPIFLEAKNKGRPVGSFISNKNIVNYLDIDDIVSYGLKKYPWLCVVSLKLGNTKTIFAKSHKIPIKEIMALYRDVTLTTTETLKIINAELIKYK